MNEINYTAGTDEASAPVQDPVRTPAPGGEEMGSVAAPVASDMPVAAPESTKEIGSQLPTELPPQTAPQTSSSPATNPRARVTGLSGNEIYCIEQLGFTAGDVALGNSVYALGLARSIGSGIRQMLGGEITQITEFVSEGRKLALERLNGEVKNSQGVGVTGVSSDIVVTGDKIEFLSLGSMVHQDTPGDAFTSSADGQELYCQIDAGYQPLRFVFGNVAYSVGIGRGILGSLKTLARGEIPEYSEIFTTTRNLALQRIADEAKASGANATLNIRTKILPFAGGYGTQEMIMIGTASHNPNLPAEYAQAPVTSDLTNQELWSLTQRGYIPVKLLLATSVYSLGFLGGVSSFLKSFRKGEIPELTKLVYEAREKVIGKIKNEAEALGVEDVVGTKIYLYELGSGLIEVLAIGTAVKRSLAVSTKSQTILPQAIINDKDTFVDKSYITSIDLNKGQAGV